MTIESLAPDLAVIVRELTRKDYKNACIYRTTVIPKAEGPEPFSVFRKVGCNPIPGQCLGVDSEQLVELLESEWLIEAKTHELFGKSWVINPAKKI